MDGARKEDEREGHSDEDIGNVRQRKAESILVENGISCQDKRGSDSLFNTALINLNVFVRTCIAWEILFHPET